MKQIIVKIKKPVPYQWYKEVCNEMARAYMEARIAPKRQMARITAVVESGLDYEVMHGGAGHSWQIPLSKLRGFLADSLAVDVNGLLTAYEEFKATHEGIKGLNGNLRAAKMEAELKKIKNPSFSDAEIYDYYGTLVNRHYLSNKQSDELMAFCMKIGIL
jgi:sulfite reductase beta subunit-like hemoprotein